MFYISVLTELQTKMIRCKVSNVESYTRTKLMISKYITLLKIIDHKNIDHYSPFAFSRPPEVVRRRKILHSTYVQNAILHLW